MKQQLSYSYCSANNRVHRQIFLRVQQCTGATTLVVYALKIRRHHTSSPEKPSQRHPGRHRSLIHGPMTTSSSEFPSVEAPAERLVHVCDAHCFTFVESTCDAVAVLWNSRPDKHSTPMFARRIDYCPMSALVRTRAWCVFAFCIIRNDVWVRLLCAEHQARGHTFLTTIRL